LEKEEQSKNVSEERLEENEENQEDEESNEKEEDEENEKSDEKEDDEENEKSDEREDEKKEEPQDDVTLVEPTSDKPHVELTSEVGFPRRRHRFDHNSFDDTTPVMISNPIAKDSASLDDSERKRSKSLSQNLDDIQHKMNPETLIESTCTENNVTVHTSTINLQPVSSPVSMNLASPEAIPPVLIHSNNSSIGSNSVKYPPISATCIHIIEDKNTNIYITESYPISVTEFFLISFCVMEANFLTSCMLLVNKQA